MIKKIRLLYFAALIFPLVLTTGNASELEKIAKDRPQLLDVISPGDDIWQWLDKHFQSTNGLPAKWSSELPNLPSHYLASHTFASDGAAIIMVAGSKPDGTPVGGDEFLSMLVFELLNAAHRDEFNSLDEAARQRKIDKETYVVGMAHIEYTSALELRQFRLDLWIPHAIKKGLRWDQDFWKQGTNDNFDIYLRIARGMNTGYPDDVYGPRYDSLSKENPSSAIGDASAYFDAGNAKKRNGDLDGAILDYNKAIDISPNYFHAYDNRGNAKEAKGDLAGAILDYDKAIELDPTNAKYYCNRGRAKISENDMLGALSDYEHAIQIDPNNSSAYCGRGYISEKKGDLNGAISDYSQALKLDSKNSQAYNNLVRAESIKRNAPADQPDLKQLNAGNTNSGASPR